MMRAEGWFLYRGDDEGPYRPGRLVRESFELSECASDEIIAEPLYGCWEANMDHSLARQPIDICRERGEEKVIVGNAGVVRVIATGDRVREFAPHQVAMLFAASVVDRHGYPEKMLAYDAPRTMGCLATRMKVREHELLPLPDDGGIALAQWAAFSVRYVTAWANFELAFATLRAMLDVHECPAPHVWGWGGGTTFAELDLARRAGCQTVMLSGNERRLTTIQRSGITPIDRRAFADLSYDDVRLQHDLVFRRAYLRAETAFLDLVHARTDGEGVHVFIDYIGSPVLRATLRAIGRVGVITTAGWKVGMITEFLRATECIARRQHVHTHYARRAHGHAAIAYAARERWLPPIDEPIWSFDDIPRLAEAYTAGETGLFPVFRINPE